MDEDLKNELTSAFEEQSESENNESINENGEQLVQQQPVDEWLDAPKSFKKEYNETFKSIPLDMRKYLHEREKEVERGFSDIGNKLNGYKFVDDAYSSRAERLGNIPSKEWIESLAKIDDMMESDPQGTIMAIAEAYGIDLSKQSNVEPSQDVTMQKITTLESNLNNYMKQQQSAFDGQRAKEAFEAFVSAKNEDGSPKHQYFDKVRQDMGKFIGVAKDLEEAYNMAIWQNQDIRSEMITRQQESELEKAAKDAEKAKAASFSPKGRAQPQTSGNLRDILEAQFAGVPE